MVVGSDALIQANQSLVVGLAAAHRLPAIYTFRDFVEAGGLVSYGVSLPDLYRRAAAYVVRILNGAKPLDLPIEQPTKFDLTVGQLVAAGRISQAELSKKISDGKLRFEAIDPRADISSLSYQ